MTLPQPNELNTSDILTQLEILAGQGWSDAHIAQKLGLREREVKDHIVRLQLKHGFRSRVEVQGRGVVGSFGIIPRLAA